MSSMSAAQPLPDPITPAQARLLAEVAHELRTPLNAVLGFADILRARLHGPLDERYAACAEMIHEAGRHMLSLIGDLQDLAQGGGQPLALEPLDARAPMRTALGLLRPAFAVKGVALEEAMTATPLPLRGDARALTQVAMNLLANALHATPAGGTVTLTLAEAEGAVALTVADTGAGLAASPPPGAGGLGLGIVRGLVAAHGGAFHLGDAPGGGALAVVRLPAEEA